MPTPWEENVGCARERPSSRRVSRATQRRLAIRWRTSQGGASPPGRKASARLAAEHAQRTRAGARATAISVDGGAQGGEHRRGDRRPRLPCCGVPPRLTLPAHASPGPLFFVPQVASRWRGAETTDVQPPPEAAAGPVNAPGRAVEVGRRSPSIPGRTEVAIPAASRRGRNAVPASSERARTGSTGRSPSRPLPTGGK